MAYHLTFEAWFQADQKRLQSRASWSYPQHPEYHQVCRHRERQNDYCDECGRMKGATYEIMRMVREGC